MMAMEERQRLTEIRQEAEGYASLARLAARRANMCRASVRGKIEEYAKERINLLLAELKARGLSWCTRCKGIFPAVELRFMVFEGEVEDGPGYLEPFLNVHRVCDQCYKQVSAPRSNKYPPFFYVHDAERREDGYYFCEGGANSKPQKAEENACKLLSDPPAELVEKLAEEFKLPPEIELSNQGDKVVVV